MTNGRHGLKPRVEISQEPLIEDIETEDIEIENIQVENREVENTELENTQNNSPDFLAAFIEAETKEILSPSLPPLKESGYADSFDLARREAERELEIEQELEEEFKKQSKAAEQQSRGYNFTSALLDESHKQANLSDMIAEEHELEKTPEKNLTLNFSSLNELQSLATELLKINSAGVSLNQPHIGEELTSRMDVFSKLESLGLKDDNEDDEIDDDNN